MGITKEKFPITQSDIARSILIIIVISFIYYVRNTVYTKNSKLTNLMRTKQLILILPNLILIPNFNPRIH